MWLRPESLSRISFSATCNLFVVLVRRTPSNGVSFFSEAFSNMCKMVSTIVSSRSPPKQLTPALVKCTLSAKTVGLMLLMRCSQSHRI
jgi:hypothetical protein